jgi:hypothetical protein
LTKCLLDKAMQQTFQLIQIFICIQLLLGIVVFVCDVVDKEELVMIVLEMEVYRKKVRTESIRRLR